MKLAPIILFAYRRPHHLRRTLEALALNTGASESHLTIYCDAPRLEEDYPLTAAVRSVAMKASGFSSIRVMERTNHLGLSRSIIDGVGEGCSQHGRVIVVEDDLVTSPYFLRYMNDALEVYAEVDKVAAVCGYLQPLKDQLPETFLTRMVGCWGWATWQRAWQHFEPNGEKLLADLEQRGDLPKFDLHGAYPYSALLRDHLKGRIDSWYVRWYASVFLQNRLGLHPGRSLVNNIGFDGSGTHCGVDGGLTSKVSDLPVEVLLMPAVEDLSSLHVVRRFLLRRYGRQFPWLWVRRLQKLAALASGLLKGQKRLQKRCSRIANASRDENGP